MEQVDAGEQMRKWAKSPSGWVVLFTTLETPSELGTTKNTPRKPAFRALSNPSRGLHSPLPDSSYDRCLTQVCVGQALVQSWDLLDASYKTGGRRASVGWWGREAMHHVKLETGTELMRCRGAKQSPRSQRPHGCEPTRPGVAAFPGSAQVRSDSSSHISCQLFQWKISCMWPSKDLLSSFWNNRVILK